MVDRDAPHSLPPLAAGPRFLAVLATWALLNLAQPGSIRPEGFGHLAFFALTPWAWAASRPGARAFRAEWAAHALGLLGWFLWMRHLLPWLLVPMAIVPSLMASSPAIMRSRLDLPQPLGPTSTTNSPSATARSTPETASTVGSPG